MASLWRPTPINVLYCVTSGQVSEVTTFFMGRALTNERLTQKTHTASTVITASIMILTDSMMMSIRCSACDSTRTCISGGITTSFVY